MNFQEFLDQGIFGYNYRYALLHPWVIVEQAYLHTKWFCQRGWRGYADRDVCSIDYYLAGWMPKALRQLNKYGVPGSLICEMYPEHANSPDGFTEEDFTSARERWVCIVEDIARGFEAAKAIGDMEFETQEQSEILQAELDHGLNQFRKYFLNLWD